MPDMPSRNQFNSNEEYNAYFRAYRAKNREKMRAYNRDYNHEWRQLNGYHNEENYKKRYPDKESARRKLQRAVRLGRMERKPCEVCGNVCSQGHHDNYDKPLEVRWLCPLHHTEIHMAMRAKA